MYHRMTVPGDSLYEPTHVGGTLRNNKKIIYIKSAVNWNKILHCDCVYKGTLNAGQKASFVLLVQRRVNYYSE